MTAEEGPMATVTATEPVVFEEHGEITVLKLNRPERLNAFTGDMADSIGRFAQSLNEGAYDTKCVIVTGEGRAFSAGADVREGLARRIPGNETEKAPWRPSHPERYAIRSIRDCDIPFISAINGHCVGMGWGLALGTELRVAADSAQCQVSQRRRGFMADCGLGHLDTQQAGRP
ncbi:MAG: enoyl-CoA hydratase/isomerase family protein, partial [Chloroflexi bacterium]|nr:enoyl-CoA hydratase/isomerase family protein [Chloroflexota bacterium]